MIVHIVNKVCMVNMVIIVKMINKISIFNMAIIVNIANRIYIIHVLVKRVNKVKRKPNHTN